MIGSSSDIGLELLKVIPLDTEASLTLIGRRYSATNDSVARFKTHNFRYCDFNDLAQSESLSILFSRSIPFDLVIFAAGVLPQENCELNQILVKQTFTTNATSQQLIASSLYASILGKQRVTIVYLSSIVVVRPKLRNFTYGASKVSTDYFFQGLAMKYSDTNIQTKIVRLGFVKTKMTRNFQPVPLATSKDSVARSLSKQLNSRASVIYSPGYLRLVFLILRFLPNRAFIRL
jgi:decaprenylphospho-beta-D-erythro-pentofuranosid-2-ulose 2-reductase